MTDRPVRLIALTSPAGVDDLALSADHPVATLLGPLGHLLRLDPAAEWALWHTQSQRDHASAGAGRLAADVTLAEVGVLDGDGLELRRA